MRVWCLGSMIITPRHCWALACRYLVHDAPPLSGEACTVAYCGMLLLALISKHSVVLDLDFAATTPPEYYYQYTLLPVPPISAFWLVAVRWATLAAWALACAGAWRRWTSIATALGMIQPASASPNPVHTAARIAEVPPIP